MTTANSNVNMTVGNLFRCGTGIFYVVSSVSATNYSGLNNGSTGYNTYVEYVTGTFTGGGSFTYISSYGCSARIVGRDTANSNIGNIYPSNCSTQACNSFSYSGRAYFSSS